MNVAWLGTAETDAAENEAIRRYEQYRRWQARQARLNAARYCAHIAWSAVLVGWEQLKLAALLVWSALRP